MVLISGDTDILTTHTGVHLEGQSKMFPMLLRRTVIAVGAPITIYLVFLGLLTTTWFQSHVVYLHAVQMTWFKDLNVPEMFGFLPNQVTPFRIQPDGSEQLYAWHILPVGLYRLHEESLLAEPSGIVLDIQSRVAFQLLRNDPDARLVIHMHGAGGTIASGHRIPNYRALSAGQPEKVHVLTFDYRGFGRVSGRPSEHGVILDALAVVDWAFNVAKVPPARILIFGQSLGTAVNIAVAEHFAQQNPSVVFAGHILVAPFVDTTTLISTYRIAGIFPILGPLTRFSLLFDYLSTFVRDKWLTKARIAEYVRLNEAQGNSYQLTMIHAEDDYDIPWQHTSVLFWHAANATCPEGILLEELETENTRSKTDLGSAGSRQEWRTNHGIIRKEILKYGLHDAIMGYPVITLAVMRIFDSNG